MKPFTENVNVLPTLCEVIGEPVPLQCDGRPLTPFLLGEEPRTWRTGNWTGGASSSRVGLGGWPDDQHGAPAHLATVRTVTHAYVQFGDR